MPEKLNQESGGEKAEKITLPAIRYRGQVYDGHSHGQIFGELQDLFGEDFVEDDIEEGFKTDTGRFVDREEAKVIAQGSGQYKKPVDHETPELYSDDFKKL